MPLLERIAFQGGSIQRVGAARELRAERVLKHPFPGIELEGELNSAIVEIDEAAIAAEADVLDIHQRGLQPGLARGVLQIGQRAGILDIVSHPGEMQMLRAADVSSRRRSGAHGSN